MKYENSNIKEVFGRLKSSKNGLTEKDVEKRLKNTDLTNLKINNLSSYLLKE